MPRGFFFFSEKDFFLQLSHLEASVLRTRPNRKKRSSSQRTLPAIYLIYSLILTLSRVALESNVNPGANAFSRKSFCWT